MSGELLLELFGYLLQKLPDALKGIDLLRNYFLSVLEELNANLMR